MAREVAISDNKASLTLSLQENAASTDLESTAAGSESDPHLPTALLAAEFNYVPPEQLPYPPAVRWTRRHIFKIFLGLTFGGTIVFLFFAYFVIQPHDDRMLFLPCNKKWKDLVKYLSIPLVSIIFTWWHVWLGIKMCFYPVEFVGCCYPFLGWQGIVPRRAHVMAGRSCDIMIGTLVTVEEIIDRIHPDDFFTSLEGVISQTSAAVLGRLANRHYPNVWARLPDSVKRELQTKVVEESQKMFKPVIKDLKGNINQIVDIKQMAIDVLVENKPLLVEMFQKIGEREFVFIQHVSAVMGFILGIIQMFLWLAISGDEEQCHTEAHKQDFHCWASFVVLPVSGLIIGYFTNWLGINMIFRPVEPHIICGGYVNIQGVFLKRQQQVSQELTTMICKHLVHARKMLEYIVRRPEVVQKMLEIYQKHMEDSIIQVMGRAKTIIPMFLGQGAVENIRAEVVQETLDELPKHSQEIEEYMDRAFGLRDTLAYRLSRLHPSRFEGMLHPVFQEDEWMVLLLGAVLGVCVGLLQAVALGS